MLVSEIGYLHSNSKSLYGVEQAKSQSPKNTLGEGFGNVDGNLISKATINRRTSQFDSFVATLQSMFSSKSESVSKKYLSLIA